MCLILFAYETHPKYKLIVAANRDEFYKRPTSTAHYWNDQPNILAGKDLEKMGTWMGVTTNGRFSALTNYRDPLEETKGKHSRGELVADALNYKGNLNEYMHSLINNDDRFPGYNLLAGDMNGLFYYSNKGDDLQKLKPGIHGVSNHLLNTEWPKVSKGKLGMSKIISDEGEDMVEELFNLLLNTEISPDHLLPKTGVTLEWERMLSPMFIKSKDYGTRSSTVLLMTDKDIQYVERTYLKDGIKNQEYKIVL
jgi:uncharacterized protein with NRDE domain